MASREALRRGCGGEWQRLDFTLGENLVDLNGHEADSYARRNFTQAAMEPTATRCLGCVEPTHLRTTGMVETATTGP